MFRLLKLIVLFPFLFSSMALDQLHEQINRGWWCCWTTQESWCSIAMDGSRSWNYIRNNIRVPSVMKINITTSKYQVCKLCLPCVSQNFWQTVSEVCKKSATNLGISLRSCHSNCRLVNKQVFNFTCSEIGRFSQSTELTISISEIWFMLEKYRKSNYAYASQRGTVLPYTDRQENLQQNQHSHGERYRDNKKANGSRQQHFKSEPLSLSLKWESIKNPKTSNQRAYPTKHHHNNTIIHTTIDSI